MSASPAKANDPTMEEILASIRRIIADDQAPGPVKSVPVPAPTPARSEAPKPAVAAPSIPPPVVTRELEPEIESEIESEIEAAFAEPAPPVQPGAPAAPVPPLPVFTSAPPILAAIETVREAPRQEPENQWRFAPPLAPIVTAELPPASPLLDPVAPPTRSMQPLAATPLAPEPMPQVLSAWPEAPVAPPIAGLTPLPHPAEALLSPRTDAMVGSAFGSLANTILAQNARTLEDLVRDMLRPMLKTWLDDNLPSIVERLVRAEIERVARGSRG